MKKPDLATYIGLFGGVFVLLWGMASGSDLSLFLDPPSILITVGGSLASMLINHDLGQIKNMFKNMFLAFTSFDLEPQDLIELFSELARKARREGLLGLEDDINRLDDPFFAKGIQMMVDAIDPEVIRNILETDIECMVERHEENIGVIKAWAALAPAFGMIGTLIGLIQMLANLDDPSALGPGMAVALITTFYGSLMANFVLIPIAGKLEKRNADEVLIKSLILEGIIGIQSGLNPRILEEKLKAFLPKSKVADLSLEGSKQEGVAYDA
jgi:chemotaxis protein MotA